MASSLEAAGDAVVGYFLADDTMFMGAWSAADGSLLWESPAGLSHTARGVRLTPTVTDSGEVVFLSPEDASGWSTMKIVDAESGETLVHSRPVWASSRPALCEETPCVTGFSRADGDRGVWEVDDSRQWVPSPSQWIPENARSLGSSLYGTFDRPGERLGRSKEGASQWERPYEEVFAAEYSSDWGWDWRLLEDVVLVGWGAQAAEDEARFDLTQQMVVGLEAETGTAKWQVPASMFCADGDTFIIVCTFTAGSITYDDGPTYSDDTALTLNRIDIEDGSTVWTVPLDAENFGPTFGRPFLTEDDTVVRYVDGTASEIDLASGEVTAVRDDGILACTIERTLMDVLVLGGTETDQQAVSNLSGPCDVNRQPAEQFSVAAVRAAGVQVGDMYVVSTESALQGFHLGDEQR